MWATFCSLEDSRLASCRLWGVLVFNNFLFADSNVSLLAEEVAEEFGGPALREDEPSWLEWFAVHVPLRVAFDLAFFAS